jgi:hypothetical protein
MFECDQLCRLSIVYQTMAFICIGWSIVSLTLVSLDRYLAIECPLFYNVNIRTNTSLLVKGTAIVWALSAGVLLLGRFVFHRTFYVRQITLFIIVVPSLALSGFCYLRIHMTAARQLKNIASVYSNLLSVNIRLQVVKLKIIKHTFTVGLVLLIFVLTFSPMIVLN